MKQDIALFLRYLKIEKGRADNTVAAYKFDLDQFLRWVEKTFSGYPTNWDFLTGKLISRYLKYIGNQGYRNTTIARKTSSVRSLAYFLSKTGKIPFSRTLDLPPPLKIQKQKPKVIKDSQMDRLLKVVEKDQGSLSKRNRALYYLICATGLNITEAVNLDLSDIDFDKAEVVVRGKKSRTVRIDTKTVGALICYIEEERPGLLVNQDEQALFLWERSGKRLGRQYFWKALRDYAQKARLSRVNVTSRSLRATFAARQIREGLCLRELGVILGLTNDSTTRAYRQ